jgi:hypothetical protein
LSIKYASKKPDFQPRPPSEKQEGCVSVFVGNLAWNIDEETLKAAFADCGEVKGTSFAMDRETEEFKGLAMSSFMNCQPLMLPSKWLVPTFWDLPFVWIMPMTREAMAVVEVVEVAAEVVEVVMVVAAEVDVAVVVAMVGDKGVDEAAPRPLVLRSTVPLQSSRETRLPFKQ